MDSTGGITQKRQREKNTSETQPRKRARQSCDTCKTRKTKCVGVENGACQYCRTLGLPCEVNLKNRKRPFYRVSEEAYEYSIKLLRRFVSEEELPELTVESIKDALQKLGHGNARSPEAQQPRDINQRVDQRTNEGSDETQEVMEADEHPQLQEDLGCMVLDAMGKYRYVGADSSIRWNHAARMAKHSSMYPDPKIVSPLKTGLLPPTTPDSPITHRRGQIYLPSRQPCMRYVGRFFEQIHCMYWFYSPEQFYSLLDQTLEDRGTTASSSWLCSLYSIFALGSMRPNDQVFVASDTDPDQDIKQASEYLEMAKDLSAGAADEADIESVKAFGLLSLAMHAMCYSVGAYLYLGTAVRIGFSLGLHRDVCPKTNGSVERERGRRLWWTIYTLDHEMAIRFGYPCAIADDACFMKTPPPSEQIMDPGPNMPLGYQALSVSLVQLRKKISYNCFLEPAQVGGRLPINRVTESLNSLNNWLNNAPAYLNWDSSLPPQHRRPVSVLHLRYWIAIISVTRPFLLFTVSRSATSVTVPAKRRCYEELSSKCIDAAEWSVRILKRMVDEQTLSSRILFDCHCIGETMWILILAVQKLGKPGHQDMLRFCLETVTAMEKIGWCEKISPDLEARVHESGALGSVPPSQQLPQQRPAEHTCQNHEQNNPEAISGEFPSPQSASGYMDYTDLNFDGSQFDVFETLDLDTRSGLMDIFADATLSSSQLVFDGQG